MKTILFLTVICSFCGTHTVISTPSSIKPIVQTKNKIGAGSQTLRVLNMEDYIYEQSEEDGLYAPDLVKQFEDYAKDLGYTDCSVIYSTTDTNETLYSKLQTGNAFYDLICPSEYMIQKLINDNLLYKLTEEDKSMIPNYFGDEGKSSVYIKDRFSSIQASNGECIGDYSVGYMWGTLGMIFNPEYSTIQERDITFEEVIEDMQSYNALWDEKYHNTMSIKDSIRDTYAIGSLYTYQDELRALRDQYLSHEITASYYSEEIGNILNRSDKENVDEVEKNLKTLKSNSFGLEVDSGKQDIVTKKIGINLAWSGDATYSIEQAGDPEQVSEPFDLYYSLPELGSNLWFDGWAIPKIERSEAQKELALLFLDFLCDPDVAEQNMECVGYTSFIGGDSIISLVRDWYDYRTDEIYEEVDGEYYDVYYLNDNDKQVYLDYPDFLSDSHDLSLDSKTLFYDIDEETMPVMMDEETPKTYGDLTIVDSIESQEEYGVQPVDLTYFFKGTLDEYEDGDMIFYSDDYLPFYNEDGSHNISVGGQFFCQYPDEETVVRCGLMRDFGDNYKYVLKMWENFKSDPLPLWAVILFVAEVVAIAGAISIYVISKNTKKRLRQKRKEQQ